MRVYELVDKLSRLADQNMEVVVQFDCYYRGSGVEEVDDPYLAVDEGNRYICIGSIYSQP